MRCSKENSPVSRQYYRNVVWSVNFDHIEHSACNFAESAETCCGMVAYWRASFQLGANLAEW